MPSPQPIARKAWRVADLESELAEKLGDFQDISGKVG
jgi:hypothetical protein